MSTKKKFWEIIEEEMKKRGIKSYRALEKMGGVANGTISQRARDMLPPTPTTIAAIAMAMSEPDSIVREWSKGRHLSRGATGQDRADVKQLLEYYKALSYEERLRLVEHAKWVWERERARKRAGK